MPHLLKTTRNCFANSYYHRKTRFLWKNGCDISWQQIVSLYENYIEGSVWSEAHKLTREHVDLTAFNQMKVNLAAQFFSNTVVEWLKNRGHRDQEIVQYIWHMNKFFDCLNTRNLRESAQKRNPDLREYRCPDDARLTYLTDEFLGYFAEWEASVSAREGFSKGEKARMMLSHQTITGLQISVHSIVELVRFLLAQGAPFVLTHNFNQDPLEEHFSHCRHKGCANDNPSVADIQNSSAKLRIIGSSALAPVRGNITKRKTTYEVDDTPMAKRPRKV